MLRSHIFLRKRGMIGEIVDALDPQHIAHVAEHRLPASFGQNVGHRFKMARYAVDRGQLSAPGELTLAQKYPERVSENG